MFFNKLKEKHDALANTKLPPEEVAELLKKGAALIDVRSWIEAKIGMAPGATNIPLLRLKNRLNELPRDRTIVVYCGTGGARGESKRNSRSERFRSGERRRLQGHPEDSGKQINLRRWLVGSQTGCLRNDHTFRHPRS